MKGMIGPSREAGGARQHPHLPQQHQHRLRRQSTAVTVEREGREERSDSRDLTTTTTTTSTTAGPSPNTASALTLSTQLSPTQSRSSLQEEEPSAITTTQHQVHLIRGEPPDRTAEPSPSSASNLLIGVGSEGKQGGGDANLRRRSYAERSNRRTFTKRESLPCPQRPTSLLEALESHLTQAAHYRYNFTGETTAVAGPTPRPSKSARRSTTRDQADRNKRFVRDLRRLRRKYRDDKRFTYVESEEEG